MPSSPKFLTTQHTLNTNNPDTKWILKPKAFRSRNLGSFLLYKSQFHFMCPILTYVSHLILCVY